MGRKVRLRRQLSGLTQVVLAAKLGISFQQLQKYEKGTNRIGAGRLEEIATALGVSPSFFFGDEVAGQVDVDGSEVMDRFLALPEAVDLMMAFAAVEQRRVRRLIINIVRQIQAFNEEPASVKGQAED